MAEWIKVAAREALVEGAMIEREVGGQRIVLALQGGRLAAFTALCPHASASLVAGDLRAGYVICPLHAYRFDLRTGACLKPKDGPRLYLFEAELREDGAWVRP